MADRNAELAMRAELARLCPECGILGEEFGLERPEARLRWVLDPIDGTRAFITGRPIFGTLVALLDGDTPVVGIIDQPVTGERWIGAAGRPTMFTGPLGGRVGTRACAASSGRRSCPHKPRRCSATICRGGGTWRPRCGATTWGGDCYAYGLLALGQIDVIVECDLKPWDWAALLPVIEGAGGRLTDWQGKAPRSDGTAGSSRSGDPALLDDVVPGAWLTVCPFVPIAGT